MEKITIEEIRKEINQMKSTANGRIYSEQFKKMIIKFHYSSGMTITSVATKTGLSTSLVNGWKRLYGYDHTAFTHGTKMRNDVRTKCLAVKEVIENNLKIETAANIYGVSVQSIKHWLGKYRDEYLSLIDSPDGIPYIIKEKKMVYGRENINKIRALLQGQADQLMCLIGTMHMSGAQAEAMKKCAEATLARETELTQAADLLSENGIEIQ